MKYYFFRDLCNQSNLSNGRSYHAAGYVVNFHCELDKPTKGGYDMVVSFVEPFSGSINAEWRALSDVELFEVSEDEYKALMQVMSVYEVGESN